MSPGRVLSNLAGCRATSMRPCRLGRTNLPGGKPMIAKRAPMTHDRAARCDGCSRPLTRFWSGHTIVRTATRAGGQLGRSGTDARSIRTALDHDDALDRACGRRRNRRGPTGLQPIHLVFWMPGAIPAHRFRAPGTAHSRTRRPSSASLTAHVTGDQRLSATLPHRRKACVNVTRSRDRHGTPECLAASEGQLTRPT